MSPPLSVNFLYDKTKQTEKDGCIPFFEKLFRNSQDIFGSGVTKPKYTDIRDVHVFSDIQVQINTPIYSAVPWAHVNIMYFTEEYNKIYDTYMPSYDYVIFEKKESYDLYLESGFQKGFLLPTLESSLYEHLLIGVRELIINRHPKSGHFHCPPVLTPDECPPISIITPTYNREKLIQIAFHNLLSTDYPHDKIEWIVIEDNESKNKMASEAIINFQIQVPKIKLKYIPIEGRMSIGEKRNHAIENSSNDIILFMDDDDHYPVTSFRRRVAWLTKGTKCGKVGFDIACCTTLALYDLKTGISAVNIPPYDISFSKRISEATLTFKKSAWVERKFPDVSISEGEEWISGREQSVIEIPPQQIIVAFSHGNNKSSRRIPPTDTPPACFWGFPKEYLIFIHKLAGVEVEEDKRTNKKK